MAGSSRCTASGCRIESTPASASRARRRHWRTRRPGIRAGCGAPEAGSGSGTKPLRGTASAYYASCVCRQSSPQPQRWPAPLRLLPMFLDWECRYTVRVRGRRDGRQRSAPADPRTSRIPRQAHTPAAIKATPRTHQALHPPAILGSVTGRSSGRTRTAPLRNVPTPDGGWTMALVVTRKHGQALRLRTPEGIEIEIVVRLAVEADRRRPGCHDGVVAAAARDVNPASGRQQRRLWRARAGRRPGPRRPRSRTCR